MVSDYVRFGRVGSTFIALLVAAAGCTASHHGKVARLPPVSSPPAPSASPPGTLSNPSVSLRPLTSLVRGTNMSGTISGCPGAQLYFHDSYNYSHPLAAGSTGLFLLPLRTVSGTSDSFTLLWSAPHDLSLGLGILVLECGNGRGWQHFLRVV